MKDSNRDILDAEGLADYGGFALSTAYRIIKEIGVQVSARRWIVHKDTVIRWMENNAGIERK